MPTWVIAGASRGLGLQFAVDLLARGETVVALARTPDNSIGLRELKESPNNKNLHIFKTDITDPVSLKAAAAETEKVTGGAIDVLINNAVLQDKRYLYKTLINFPSEEELISDFSLSFNTNVLGPILTTNAFLPLLRKGSQKKVITLNTGWAVTDLTLAAKYPKLTSYSVTKTALDMVNVKYAIALKDEGFIFLNLSPGVVNTATAPPSEDEMKEFMEMGAQIMQEHPDWKGPMQPSESVAMMLKVIDGLTTADSGKFISHHGNREFV